MGKLSFFSHKSISIRILAFFLLTILVALSLSGCLFQDELLEKQLDLFISCMNDNDPERLFNSMHPLVRREDFDFFFQQVEPLWHLASTKDFSMTNVQIKTRQVNGERYGRSMGVWKVQFEQVTYQLVLVYDVDEKGSGIAKLSFEPLSEVRTSIQISAFLITSLYLAFIVYTAIDILRKKPRKYILVLIIAVFLMFIVRVGNIKIAIPIGSIGYWILRRKLLTGQSIRKT